MLCYVMLCMLHYVTLRYVMLCYLRAALRNDLRGKKIRHTQESIQHERHPTKTLKQK